VSAADVADESTPGAERPPSRSAPGVLTRAEPPTEGRSFADRDDPAPGTGSDAAGRFLYYASLLPALLATAWVVAAFPLAALGWFQPATVIPLTVLVAAVLLPFGLGLVRRSTLILRGPWWSAAATAVIAVGFTVFAALTHSQHVIPRRDAGSYAQIGYWLAHHHGLVYRVPLAAFGSSPGQLGFASPAFYQHGATVVPQFMTGWPTMLAGAYWVGGWTGLLLLPTVVGGCAVLAVGGLAARLVGPRWAPLAALLTAGAWPVLRASQETLSEPLALLTLTAGACLLVDLVLANRKTGATGELATATALRRRIGRHCFALGVVLTGSELVRLDFGVDFAFVLPIVGWLWLTKRPGVLPFLAGSLVGGGLGVLDGAFVTRTYIRVNWSSVRLMLLLLALMAVAVVVAVLLLRRRGRSPHDLRWWRRVPPIGLALALLAEIGLFVRPYVSTDHSTTDAGVRSYVESMQRNLHLPVDGTRGYAEQSLRWVAWYLGWLAVAAAGVAAVYLMWRVLRGRDLRWLPILLLYLCPAVLTLVRPGITPDHPWADRRLVVEVLPCVALLAVWTTARLARWTRSYRPSGAVARLVPAALVPVVIAGFLVPMGFALTPVAVERTEQGELATIAKVCEQLTPKDTVLLIDQQWMPIIRSQCGLPVAQLMHPSPKAVAKVAAGVRAAGRAPIIAGSQLDSPGPLHLTPYVRVLLNSHEDERQLVHRPDETTPLHLEFWAARP
jgi:hypothetical protein